MHGGGDMALFVVVFYLFGHVTESHLHQHISRLFDHHLCVIRLGEFSRFAGRLSYNKMRLMQQNNLVIRINL
ncbi:MAG: hypothetical protein ACFC03_01260 [Candidatus Malihini olakiniferum]